MFKDCIPERILSGHTDKFVTLLESLLAYKHQQMFNASRMYNPILLNDKRWLLRRLNELGFNFPEFFPIMVLQQILLNADTLVKTRGSKIGTELFCSILTLGEVTLDDSEFYEESQGLILDSLVNGYITEDNIDILYLVDDSEIFKNRSSLTITICSKLFAEHYAKNIQEYLEKEITNWTGFNPGKEISFIFNLKEDLFYHRLLNHYFV